MRTKFYLLLIALVVAVGNICGQENGDTFTDGVLNYRITNAANKIVEVARGNYSGDITVPSTVPFGGNDYKVESIGAYAFYRSQGMRSVVLSEGLKTIGSYAFGLDSSLVSVTINTTTLTTIGNDAFRACVALKEITIPEGVRVIGNNAFMGSWELGVVNIPSTLATIGNNAFYGCPEVKSFNVESANAKFASVNGVLFNKDLTVLVAYPNGSDETSFALPHGITTLDTRMFMWATNLAEFVEDGHPEFSVIGGVLFDKEEEVLIYCPPGKVDKYKIPDGVLSIASGAFMGSKLTKIILPASVEDIKLTTTFWFCTELVEFEVDALSAHFKSDAGVLFDKEMAKLVAYPNAKPDEVYELPASVNTIGEHSFAHSLFVKNVKLPDGLTTIDDSAFFLAESLETINLPNSITSLNNSSLASCESLKNITLPDNMISIPATFLRYSTSLKSIVIPQSVTSIGSHAFQYSGLESVSLPDNLLTIGTRAFDATQLTSVVIPEKVTSIGVGAFVDNPNLKEVTFLSDTPPANIGADAFYGIAEDAYIIIPAGKKDDYVKWSADNNLPFTADNIYEATTVVVDPATGLKFIEVATGKVLDKFPQAKTGKDYIILPEDDENYEVKGVQVNGVAADRNADGQFYVTLDGNKNIQVTIAPKVFRAKHTVTIEHLAGITVSKTLDSYEVEEGDAFSFTATATDATSAVTVYVNGTELAPISDDFYYIDGITEDLLITFNLSGGDTPTANESLSAVKISASVGAITIEAPKTVDVQIISIAGQLVYSSDVIKTTVNVPSGIYAVVVDGVATKVVVK